MRLVLLDDYQGVADDVADWTVLPESVTRTTLREQDTSIDELVTRLEPFEIIMPMRERTRMSGELLEQLPNLQLLANAGMRAPGIDLAAATDLGILVCGTGTEGEGPMQQAWALILGSARHVPREDRATREGQWGTTLGMDLAGKTIGLIGLGKIGSRMAQVAGSFGMDVIAWSQNLTEEAAHQCGARWVPKETLFRESDIVSVHLRLSERTRGIVGAEDLANMKTGALFINISRGGLVDEPALIDALANKRIAGAGLDVFAEEPLPADHPLLRLPNTVLSPHVGYVTDTQYHSYYQGVADAVRAFVEGQPIRVLNPEVLDQSNCRATHLTS